MKPYDVDTRFADECHFRNTGFPVSFPRRRESRASARDLHFGSNIQFPRFHIVCRRSPGHMQQRKKTFQCIGLTAAAIIMAALLFQYNPASSGVFPPCPFHKLTGLYCPGCGSLRALHQLFHGHLAAAFGLNPLMILSLPFVAYGLTAQFLHDFFDIKIPVPFISARWIWAIFTLILLYAIARNIPVTPFTHLAP